MTSNIEWNHSARHQWQHLLTTHTLGHHFQSSLNQNELEIVWNANLICLYKYTGLKKYFYFTHNQFWFRSPKRFYFPDHIQTATQSTLLFLLHITIHPCFRAYFSPWPHSSSQAKILCAGINRFVLNYQLHSQLNLMHGCPYICSLSHSSLI